MSLRDIYKYNILFLLSVVIILIIFNVYIAPLSKGKDVPAVCAKPMKDKQIARELLLLADKLDANFPPKHKLVYETIQQLKKVVSTLSPALLRQSKWKRIQWEICPEVFTHSNRSEPFAFTRGGWVKTKSCAKDTPLATLITVALLLQEFEEICDNKPLTIIKEIQRLHPGIKIIVGGTSTYCPMNMMENVTFVDVNKSVTPGRAWNLLMKSVSTPYVLVGRNLDGFTHFVKLERHIFAMNENANVYAVGGAFRNETGHWQVGCYQSETRMYQLKYTDGYYASNSECMFCDHLLGPFVAKRSLFKEIGFDPFLSEPTLFDDFFLRLKVSEKYHVMSCPDSMFFATDPYWNDKMEHKALWLSFVRKWKFNELHLPGHKKHRFSCRDTRSSCTEISWASKTRAMPLCCMEQVPNAFKHFLPFMNSKNISFYIEGGTLLGAVKFRNVVPWDFDGDVSYYRRDNAVLRKYRRIVPNKTEFYLDNFDLKKPAYIQLKTPDIAVEITPNNLTAIDFSEMPEYFLRKPTLVQIQDVWVPGPPSPGLYLRNMYGEEYLKHASGWWHTSKLWFDTYNAGSGFYPCDKPKHHSCNDQYPIDGSLYILFE